MTTHPATPAASDGSLQQRAPAAGLADIEAAAGAVSLCIHGAFHPAADDPATAGAGTVVLLGPLDAQFWDRFTQSPEWADGRPDPVDRWSARVIGELAARFGGQARFPFGKPWQPFVRWALASGRMWVSPVGMLVHDRAGLMVSLRGALLLPERRTLPEPPAASPCEACTCRPCLSACPAGAVGGAAGYDVPACHRFLDTPAGGDCLRAGCAVRRACPLSARWGRCEAQSAHHMAHFHPGGA